MKKKKARRDIPEIAQLGQEAEAALKKLLDAILQAERRANCDLAYAGQRYKNRISLASHHRVRAADGGYYSACHRLHYRERGLARRARAVEHCVAEFDPCPAIRPYYLFYKSPPLKLRHAAAP